MITEAIGCDIESEVLACFSLVSRQSAAAGVRLSSKIGIDASRLQADGRMCRQNLLNLLSNAIEFSDQGGEVHVCSRRILRYFPVRRSEAYAGVGTRSLRRYLPALPPGFSGIARMPGKGMLESSHYGPFEIVAVCPG